MRPQVLPLVPRPLDLFPGALGRACPAPTCLARAVLVLILLTSAAFGQTPSRLVDYALVLEDAPVARKVASRAALHGAAAQAQLQRIRSAQSGVLAELARRKVKVISTAQTLLNAVFVTATSEEAAPLASIPGVVRVVHLPRYKPALDKAVGLVNIPVGGVAGGGAV